MEMNRRRFIMVSMGGAAGAFASILVARSVFDLEVPGLDSTTTLGAVTPDPAIKAAVDVLVPADPLIPGDFKGSDYGAHQVLADTLGSAGQTAMVTQLNSYAWKVAWKLYFKNCTPAQQLAAIKQWISERDTLSPINRDLLTALLTISVIGTYERKTPAQRLVLFESMGWYDPNDPGGTFMIPCYGYD
jgi:hypothetical protein